MLADIDLDAMIPMPKTSLMLAVDNETEINNIINILLKDAEIKLKSQEVKGSEIKYFVIPFINVRPAYCFCDDYLIISVDYKIIEKSILASRDASLSLYANKDIKK